MKLITTSDVKTLPVEASFKELFKSKFYGVLRWQQLDHIWDVIKLDKSEGWYVYEINKEIPTTLLKANDLTQEIDFINNYVRKEHDEEYCGIVYADDLESPEYIKVFDPKNLGSSCSIAKTPPLPKWIISKAKPQALTEEKEHTNKPKRWLGNLFSK